MMNEYNFKEISKVRIMLQLKIFLLFFYLFIGIIKAGQDTCYLASLKKKAESVLASNFEGKINGILPSKITDPYQCSFTSSIVAWALAHEDGAGAQRELRASLQGQWNNGFLPQITYLDDYEYGAYVNGTLFPGAMFWGTLQETNKLTSGILAVPIHAQAALQVYTLSKQDASDLGDLQEAYEALYKFHNYLKSSGRIDDDGLAWSFHPWETMVPLAASPGYWKRALNLTWQSMEEDQWQLPEIPARMLSLFEYPGDEIYGACIYLANCLRECNYSVPCINLQCPFRVKDVGFNSILLRSSQALYKIAVILMNSAEFDPIITNAELSELELQFQKQQDGLRGLWSENERTYRSQCRESTQGQEECSIRSGSLDLVLPLFSDKLMDAIRTNLTFNLVTRSAPTSLNCFDYPFPSDTCDTELNSPQLQVDANFFVQRGLALNKELGLSEWVRAATLALFCGSDLGTPLSTFDSPDDATLNFSLSLLFDPSTGSSLPNMHGLESSLAAAVAINLIFPDGNEDIGMKAPIRHSLLFALMLIELCFAFAVGVLCILFSFNLVRRLRREHGDPAVQTVLNESVLIHRHQMMPQPMFSSIQTRNGGRHDYQQISSTASSQSNEEKDTEITAQIVSNQNVTFFDSIKSYIPYIRLW